MSAPRAGRFQKATALLPLAMLSMAATASLAGVGPTTAVADQAPVATLPDGSTVPSEAIEAPASVSPPPGVEARGVTGNVDRAVARASASGIPAAALSAYQRAETVINAADKSCDLGWQLIAAIGRVESDHGRANGNTLNDDGLAVPGIYGIPLDGSNDTQAISDTDAGQYDSDSKWDRAVGPMQFIPSTWSVVGVDGDNDGERNPQDIDDAALATAVYLCSGDDDLSTEAGQRAAVFRYNHSNAYVDLVLSFMDAYLEGDFTSVPNGTTTFASTFVPAPEPTRPERSPRRHHEPRPAPVPSGGTDGGGGDDGGSRDDNVTVTETEPKDPIDPPPPAGGGGGGGGKDNDGTVSPPKLPDPPVKEVEDVLTEKEATVKCLAEVGADSVANLDPLQLTEFDACMKDLGF